MNVPSQTCFVAFYNKTSYENSSIFSNQINIINSQPLLTTNYVYIGGSDGNLYQFDALNVSKNISRFSTGSPITTTPIYLNGYVYVISNNKYVYQLSATDVSIQIANFTFNQQINSTLIADNNFLYVFTEKNVLFKLNSSNINQVIQNVSFAEPPLYDAYYGYSENSTYQSPSLYRENIYVTKGGFLYKFNVSNINNYQYSYYNVSSVFDSFSDPTMGKLFNPVISNDNIYLSSSSGTSATNVFGFLLQINATNISRLLNYYSPISNAPLGVFTDITILNGIGFVNVFTRCETIYGCAPHRIIEFLTSNISNPIGHTNSSFTTSNVILVYDNVTHFTNGINIKTTSAFDTLYYPLQQCPSANFVPPTETHDSVISKYYLNINASTTKGSWNVSNTSVSIFFNGVETKYITNSSVLFVNYTLSVGGIYYFNATSTDKKNNVVHSNTIKVLVSSESTIEITYPIDGQSVPTLYLQVLISVPRNTTSSIEYIKVQNYNSQKIIRNLSSACYQESATISNQKNTDGNCGLDYTGYYNFNNNFNDGDWGTDIGGGGDWITSYKKPKGIVLNATWLYKTGGAYYVLPVPFDCFNYSQINITFLTDVNRVGYCYNGTFKAITGANAQRYEEAINWYFGSINFNPSNNTIGYSKGVNNTINKSVSFTNIADTNFRCWYADLFDGTKLSQTNISCFSVGSCFDEFKNQDETDVDYNGICGYCKNYTLYSDDTSFQALKEAGLYSYPFNESQCDEGDAVVGFATFTIFFVLIGIVGIFGVLIFFVFIPMIVFIGSGKWSFFWWLLLFRRKKKQEKEDRETFK